MSLTPEEIKQVLEEAKGDGPRNAARKVLLQHTELLMAAAQQQLPPWDRRWLEFEAIDQILAAYGGGAVASGNLDHRDVSDGQPAVEQSGGGSVPEVDGRINGDAGNGGEST